MKATGERWERRLWREERPERVAAVCVQRRRAVAKAHTGNRNRTIRIRPAGGETPPYKMNVGNGLRAVPQLRKMKKERHIGRSLREREKDIL